jgi:colanic acid/amylovoran biosynthesis glycosyltransferase
VVLAPLVPGGHRRQEREGYEVRRFRFFPRRWEDLADGAILENLRARPSRWLQVPSFFLAGALAVRRAVRDLDPDVIHVHWIIPQGLMALLSARRVPWLVTTLGGDLYALTSAPLRFLKGQVLRRASTVTVMNREMRRAVIDLGVPEDKVRVLPMGVELARVHRGDAPSARVPGRLVFVGRLVEKKGVRVLLDALGDLPPAIDWSLDVVGDGPLRAELEEQARPLGSRVTFHGQQGSTELGRLLATAEVAVFPSVRAKSGDQDGLPVALLEAMAAGTPIVASDLPGLDDVVAGGTDPAETDPAGLLVEPGDARALTAALSTLLADGELRGRMGRSAAQRADSYSMDAIGSQYVDLLRNAVAGARAPEASRR